MRKLQQTKAMVISKIVTHFGFAHLQTFVLNLLSAIASFYELARTHLSLLKFDRAAIFSFFSFIFLSRSCVSNFLYSFCSSADASARYFAAINEEAIAFTFI